MASPRALASAASFHARSMAICSTLGRPIPTSTPQITPTASFLLRTFSQTTLLAQRPDPRNGPLNGPRHVDYDASLGDPWAPYRLRHAKPLLAPAPPKQEEATQQTAHQAPQRTGIRHSICSRRTRTIIAASLLAMLFLGCCANLEVVPVSGRWRFNCISSATLVDFLQARFVHLVYGMRKSGVTFLPAHDRRVRQVRRVMAQLLPVARGRGGANAGAAWDIFVINNTSLREANAFVLPNNTVFVRSGLLRLVQSDAQLAAVLSHEIAHNVAQHSAERLSSMVGMSVLLVAALVLVATTPLRLVAGGLLGSHALGLFFHRPLGRRLESEADYLGLLMMADACYDPREARVFWARVEQLRRGAEPPEWLSTHPSNGHRVARITEWLPEALLLHEKCEYVGMQGFADAFRRAMARSEKFVNDI